MDNLGLLADGLGAALTPENLMYAAIGVLLGTFVGVLPGIGPAMAVALLLPVTFGLEPTQAFIMFAGIYYGGMYGGSTTSILLNTPGESSSVMTAIEGNKMAKKGRAAQALATAAIGSFIAGTIGTLLVVFFAPILADVAVTIGAPSFFAIIVFAMVLVTSLLGDARLRGFISLFLGLTFGLVGMDLNTGQPRLTFGRPELGDRLDIVIVAVGIFALGEALWVAAHLRRKPLEIIPVGQPWMGKDDWGRSWKPWLRGTAIGFPFGAIPAGGAETPTFLSYILERKLARKKDEFGHGAIEGVAGPEAANNASAAGTFVPLLAMGIPVTATSAVMLAALTSYGIQPGPQLMTDQADLVWTLLASLLIGNALLLVLNLPLAPLWAKLLAIPRPYLYSGILFFASLGAYAASQRAFDIFLLLVFGMVGFMMRRFAFPVLPLIIGVILGPLMETRFREALAISGGDLSALWSENLAIVLYVLAALVIIVPMVTKRRRPASGDDVTGGPGGRSDDGSDAVDATDEEKELVQR
ncbi:MULTISPECIES: tripartite tricarboxylate transporter permease [unclassified Nocardioides]|uniref:tripartite tricarboxylate transporter permease n=1 Tax=unclassified Nocardioides TaxID=2615069 RepID=UPI0006F490FB|nr:MULTISPECIES: tripartite tricarboxylate transporter permease [unclassified Nocardioides]KQY63775.1 tripartite tricarboxylate transporter TctA [Nocardioides sp. Root140]KQZ69698.1 tripartite tricarboxylate transporter TctA [Nocardioides sp. Root151]KRF15790.1 tripartite tricarboxylate transporter TctA [Nocardioides sp. Soil796]